MKRQTKPIPGVTRPWTRARKELFTPRDLAEIDWEVARELSLSQVRAEVGQTQVAVAGTLRITQGSLSKLEHQADARLSTIRAYVEALGGTIELRAYFKGKPPMTIELVPGEPPRRRKAAKAEAERRRQRRVADSEGDVVRA